MTRCHCEQFKEDWKYVDSKLWEFEFRAIMATGILRTSGTKIVDAEGNDVLLRGVRLIPLCSPLMLACL